MCLKTLIVAPERRAPVMREAWFSSSLTMRHPWKEENGGGREGGRGEGRGGYRKGGRKRKGVRGRKGEEGEGRGRNRGKRGR